jgi:hypothetical protein
VIPTGGSFPPVEKSNHEYGSGAARTRTWNHRFWRPGRYPILLLPPVVIVAPGSDGNLTPIASDQRGNIRSYETAASD